MQKLNNFTNVTMDTFALKLVAEKIYLLLVTEISVGRTALATATARTLSSSPSADTTPVDIVYST